jgi:hypothetical protein
MGGLLGLKRNQLIRRHFERSGRLYAEPHLCAVRINPTIYRPVRLRAKLPPTLRSCARSRARNVTSIVKAMRLSRVCG